MDHLISLNLNSDMTSVISDMAKRTNHTVQDVIEKMLADALEDIKENERFTSMVKERKKKNNPILSHEEVWKNYV